MKKNLTTLLFGICAFQFLTVLLYIYGPIDYYAPPKSVIVVFIVLVYIVSLVFGAMHGGKYFFAPRTSVVNFHSHLKKSIFIMIILAPATFYFRTKGSQGLSDIGEMYSAAQETQGGAGRYLEYIRLFFGFHLFSVTPILLYYWSELPSKERILGVICVISLILTGIYSGINKNTFDFAIIAVCVFFIKNGFSVFKKPKNIIISCVMAVFLMMAGLFFGETQSTRYGSAAVYGGNPRINSVHEHDVSDGLPLFVYTAFSNYLTQGYRALDLAIGEDFVFTWGVGNSTFLSRQFDRTFKTDFINKSYPARLDKFGWNKFNEWSTFYVWIASDVSFFGVPIVMFIIGFYYSALGRTFVFFGDAVSFVMIFYLLLALFYLSANNQVMQSGESCVGFLLGVMFVFSRYSLRRIT